MRVILRAGRGCLLILAVSLGGAACSKPPPAILPPEPAAPRPQLAGTTPSGQAETALTLARSSQASDHRKLLELLRSKEFLDRLESPGDHRGPASRTRLAAVLEALKENAASTAREALLSLTAAPEFLAMEYREELLIRALAAARPAAPEAIRFWEEHGQPEAVFRHVTVDALAENGSPAAADLLEKILTHSEQEPEEVVAWMRGAVLRHRNDPAILKSCERMLSGSLKEELRPQLVEALFDYQPEAWYLSEEPPVPPERREMSKESREALIRIGELALQKLPLIAAQKEVIQKTLREIGAR